LNKISKSGQGQHSGYSVAAPTPALPYTVQYICEHFANLVCELLVNIASGVCCTGHYSSHVQLCSLLFCVHTVSFLPSVNASGDSADLNIHTLIEQKYILDMYESLETSAVLNSAQYQLLCTSFHGKYVLYIIYYL
jgi:hypothetical protein